MFESQQKKKRAHKTGKSVDDFSIFRFHESSRSLSLDVVELVRLLCGEKINIMYISVLSCFRI